MREDGSLIEHEPQPSNKDSSREWSIRPELFKAVASESVNLLSIVRR
jgi:hypothetical protein